MVRVTARRHASRREGRTTTRIAALSQCLAGGPERMPIWSTIPRAEGGFSAVTYEVHVHVVVAQRACKIKKSSATLKLPRHSPHQRKPWRAHRRRHLIRSRRSPQRDLRLLLTTAAGSRSCTRRRRLMHSSANREAGWQYRCGSGQGLVCMNKAVSRRGRKCAAR